MLDPKKFNNRSIPQFSKQRVIVSTISTENLETQIVNKNIAKGTDLSIKNNLFMIKHLLDSAFIWWRKGNKIFFSSFLWLLFNVEASLTFWYAKHKLDILVPFQLHIHFTLKSVYDLPHTKKIFKIKKINKFDWKELLFLLIYFLIELITFYAVTSVVNSVGDGFYGSLYGSLFYF